MGAAVVAIAPFSFGQTGSLGTPLLDARTFQTMKVGFFASTAGIFGAALFWLLGFKAIACWMGPEGVGLFSQLRQMAQAATIGATFGGTNAVVQGLAERGDELSRRQFRATAARYIGSAGAGTTLAMAIAAQPLTQFFLSSEAPDLVLTTRWMALAILLNIGGTYALAVLNGYRSFRYLALAQIAGPVALVTLLAGAWWWRLPAVPGILAGSFVLCFGVTYIVAAFGVSRIQRIEMVLQLGAMSRIQTRAFIWFAISNLVAAMATTFTLLLIRSWVIEVRGMAFAGMFDAGWTLTFNYTTLLLTACNAIYLPLLTAANRPEDQKTCILRMVYLVLGISTLICYVMVLFREPLINLLYSSQFQEAGRALMILVIAVLFRSASWVYGTMILATRNSRVLVVSDLVVNLLLLAATRYALDNFASLEALSWAFVLPNFLYLVFVVEFVGVKNRLMRRREIWPLLAGGALPLIYLALTRGGSHLAHPQPVLWVCMCIGMAVAVAAWVAHKRLAP